MGLTAEVEQSLRDASLTEFFEEYREAFTEMARSSYEYAASYVEAIPLPLRRDDVARILVPALNTNEGLRECLATKRLRQQYWYRHFADLVLDRLWEELHDKQAADD